MPGYRGLRDTVADVATLRVKLASHRAFQSFPQPKPGSDEFYIAGKAVLVDEQAARVEILRDAKHMAEASEIAFELWRHLLGRTIVYIP